MSELSKEMKEWLVKLPKYYSCDAINPHIKVGDVKNKLIDLESQLQAAQARIKELESENLDLLTGSKIRLGRIKELEGALNDEIAVCPDAVKANQDYCFRHRVCSVCRNNRYIKELLSPPQPKD